MMFGGGQEFTERGLASKRNCGMALSQIGRDHMAALSRASQHMASEAWTMLVNSNCFVEQPAFE
ncbi:hypothetical protein ASD67_10745 [Sphingopyxis sp. Root1497]|nr:hypothetical protein ASD67_10745 [Sphingopyxis sp. Root1497]